MAKEIGPVCKRCRREGEKLFLKGERCYSQKCAVERRAYPPGEHGYEAQFRRQRLYGIKPSFGFPTQCKLLHSIQDTLVQTCRSMPRSFLRRDQRSRRLDQHSKICKE